MKSRLLASLASILIGASLIIYGSPASADEHKVTICHAAGQDGTTKYVTLTISENAVYKDQGGHFYENGTPRAGHEDDYLGPCTTDETTTTTEATTTTVEVTTTEGSPTTAAIVTERAPATPAAGSSQLPRTGSTTWPLTATGLGLIAAGGLLLRKQRKVTWT